MSPYVCRVFKAIVPKSVSRMTQQDGLPVMPRLVALKLMSLIFSKAATRTAFRRLIRNFPRIDLSPEALSARRNRCAGTQRELEFLQRPISECSICGDRAACLAAPLPRHRCARSVHAAPSAPSSAGLTGDHRNGPVSGPLRRAARKGGLSGTVARHQ